MGAAIVGVAGVALIIYLAMRPTTPLAVGEATTATGDDVQDQTTSNPDSVDMGGEVTGTDPALDDSLNTDNVSATPDGNTPSYTLDDVLAKLGPMLQQLEGFSAKAYADPPGSGKYSIGYGHQIRAGESYNSDSVISNDEALALLRIDMVDRYTCVQNNVTAQLTLNQAVSLCSFIFNVGCPAFKSSTMLKQINAGQFDAAAQQFGRWVYAGGAVNNDLVARRQQEQTLFVG